MKCLTTQEQKVLIIIMMLLAVGGLVRVWRAAHPPILTNQPALP